MRIVTSIIAAIAATALLWVSPASAQAQDEPWLWWIHDVRGDVAPTQDRHVDVVGASLNTGDPTFLTFRVQGADFARGQLGAVRLRIDTDPADPTPDYGVAWDGRQLRLLELDSWRLDGRLVRCWADELTVNYRHDVVTYVVPRRCVGRPPLVRWNARVSSAAGFDVVPAPRRLSEWQGPAPVVE